MMGDSVVADSDFYQGATMNEDKVNMEIRKFLKKVGITSQREIEKALQEAEAAGKLDAGPFKVISPAESVIRPSDLEEI